MKADRFEVTLFTNDCVFLNVNQAIKGILTLSLKRALNIHYLMIGWSTRCNSEQVIEEKTRIGKQLYLEKVRFLVGEIDTNEVHFMEAKEHVYRFEIANHELENVDGVSNVMTKLSWHNFKAALVDHNEDIYYADVIISSNTACTSESNMKQVSEDADTNKLISLNITSNLATKDYCENASVSDNGNEGCNDVKRNLDLHCALHKPCYAFQEAISFTVQCRNNTKNGYKHLTATLIERQTRQAKRRRKSKVVASVVGPAVAPKEIILWDSQLVPLNIEKGSDCWYALKIELKKKFSTKLIVTLPIVIIENSLSPT